MLLLILIAAVVALAVAGVVFWWWLASRGDGGGRSAAYRRAAALGRATAQAYRDAAAANPDASPEELRVAALVESSGGPEPEIRRLVEEAKNISILHTSLRMLTTRIAAERERGRSGTADARKLSADIADAQRAVAEAVPDEL